jgi:hypothetical protein
MCNQLQRMDIPPNHRLVAPNLNSKSPRAGAMNPQEMMSPKGVYCPLTTQNNPQQANFLQPSQSTNSLSPQPTQPKEWDPLLCHIVPQAIPLPSRAPTQVG